MDLRIVLSLLALLITLTGCTTSNQYEVAEYDKLVESSLPGVSIFYKKASDELNADCTNFKPAGYCQINWFKLDDVAEEVAKSGLFESISYGNDESDYKLLITSATYILDTAEDSASAYLAGATLMMTPISSSRQINLEVSLLWRGLIVDEFEMEIPFKRVISVFSLSQDTDQQIAESIASHVVKKLQENNSFAPEVIAGKIQASDYESSLKIPEKIASYFHEGKQLYRHPLDGVQIRYNHEVFEYEYFDVFVYPIRQTEWEDKIDALERESVIYRKEFEIVKKEQGIQSFSLGENKFERKKIGAANTDILRIRGRYQDLDGTELHSLFFLFIQKDKFVKVRISYPIEHTSPDHDRFLTELMNKIDVPEESLFMAKLRQEWRMNTIQ